MTLVTISLNWSQVSPEVIFGGISPVGAGHIIQNEGVNLPARGHVNFVGSAVEATDDPINDVTNVLVTSTGGPGGGVTDHTDLTGRSTPNGHPIAAITGLQAALDAVSAAFATTQPLDSDLTAIAALATTAYGRAFLTLANLSALQAALGSGTPSATTYLRGDGTWSTPAGGGGAVSSVNGQTGAVVLVASDVGAQPSDADLTAIAALSTTAYGRAFLALANLAALQAVLGTGTPSATTYLRGDGTWSTPATGGGGTAATTTFTPVGTISATDVQAAIAEVATDYIAADALLAPKASPTFTGTVTIPSGAILGTPASVNLANATGLPESGVTNLTTDLGLKAPLASPTFTGTVTVPTPVNATDATTKGYVDGAVIGLLDLKGSTNCAASPNYPAALKGDAYVVSVAGKIGGASGQAVDIGDMFIAIADNAGGTDAAVGTSWVILEHNRSGVANTAGTLAQFAPTTSAQLAGVLTDETGTGVVVYSNSPALVTPTGIVKGDVGLANVDNTSDANKPVSTAQAAADALKANIASPTFTGTVTVPNGSVLGTPASINLVNATGLPPSPDSVVGTILSRQYFT